MCSLLSVGLLVVGCDSGGSNESEPSIGGAVTVKLEDSGSSSSAVAKVAGTLTATFIHQDGCTDNDGATVSSTPVEKTLDPTDFGTCDNPDDHERVEVDFSTSGSLDGLTMTVLDGSGNVIDSDSDPSDGLGIEAGDSPGNGDDNDGDGEGGDDDNGDDSGGSGDVPSSLTGNWELTQFNGEDAPFSSFLSITTEELEIIQPDGSCNVETITNVDGDQITTEGSDGGTSSGTFDISDDGNTLTTQGLVEDDSGDSATATFKSMDSVPDCS